MVGNVRLRRPSLCAWFLALLVGVGCCPEVRAQAQRPPNVVLIVMDDLGWADLGCYGSTFYRTPNLDRLTAQGVRCTSAYAAAPVCSPTRAALLTGKSPARLGLTNFLVGERWPASSPLRPVDWRKELPPTEPTVARALKEAGYATGLIGKWHLGKTRPEKYGFDVVIGGGNAGHLPGFKGHFHKDGEYLADRHTAEAEKFLEANKGRPFFLVLSHYLVHVPLQAKKNFVDRYRGQPEPPGPLFGEDGGCKVRLVQTDPVYAAMVHSMDESVGRILRKLAELGLDGDTVVLFTSDNGGLCSAEGWPTANLRLRLGKGWLYEGGVRVPLLVRWQGRTRPGSTTDVPVISTDIFPTLLAMAGQRLRPEEHRDGVNFLPALLDGKALDRQALFWHYPHYSNQGGPPSGAVRKGDFKLIEFYEGGRAELYDLRADPGERRDLAGRMPERTRELRQLLGAWRREVGAQMPGRK